MVWITKGQHIRKRAVSHKPKRILKESHELDILPPPPPSVLRKVLEGQKRLKQEIELRKLEELKRINQEALQKAEAKKADIAAKIQEEKSRRAQEKDRRVEERMQEAAAKKTPANSRKNFIVEFLDGLADKERERSRQRRDFLVEERKKELEKLKKIDQFEKKREELLLRDIRAKEEREQQKRSEDQERSAKKEIEGAIKKAGRKPLFGFFKAKIKEPELLPEGREAAGLIEYSKGSTENSGLRGFDKLQMESAGSSEESDSISMETAAEEPLSQIPEYDTKPADEKSRESASAISQPSPREGFKREMYLAREYLEKLDFKGAKEKYILLLGIYQNFSNEEKAAVYEDLRELYEDRKHAEASFGKK
ncbi:hypothetical protein HYU14_04640 [Candidatus Woesearchaeota archaeon]|nr:hypothetical protein [Candidatus Woesearchaeota archaeon]